MGCDTRLKQAALLKSRHLVTSPSYCSPTPFSPHSPYFFLWHCSPPWNFFSRLSWYTRCPVTFSCLSAFSQPRAAVFLHAHHHIKSSPQRSLGSVVLIWIDVLSHLRLFSLWYCFHRHCGVIMTVFTALHKFKQCPLCWEIPTWLLRQS